MRAYVRAVVSLIIVFRVRVAAWLLGMDYVVRFLTWCRPAHIPAVLRTFGATVGDGCRFKAGLTIDNVVGDRDSTNDFSNLYIGRGCYIGRRVFFDLPGRIFIDPECAISADVRILTHSDVGARPLASVYPRKREDVHIGEGSWIGTGATLLPGVYLDKFCVVAAGAVVLPGDYGPCSILADVPAVLKGVLTKPDIGGIDAKENSGCD